MSQQTSLRKRRPAPQRRLAWTGLITVLTLLFSLFPQVIPGAPVPTASAHNLQTRDVYAYFDQNTQNMLDTRIGGAGWVPPTALLQVGDEIGLVLKGVPRDGTTTGVGGYLDFYVPNGVTVIDAAYLQPGDSVADGITGYDKIPMKGQSPIAIGAGPIGAKVGPYLADFTPPGVNGLGFVTNVADSTGLHRGTIAGVYGDTGIFYSADPQTAWNTWAAGGGYDGNTGTSDNTLTNNSGDVIVPLNRWDGEQLVAFGMKAPAIAILDPADQRGNSPWGVASAVAGPQSGYAWQFDRDIWLAQGQNQTAARNAITMGPWQRIQYPGSGISKDQPGLISTVLGFASVDASNLGATLPLPATTSQTDDISPKVVRFSVGQTTQYVPEYAWVKLRINDLNTGFIQIDGCPYWHTGAFGGDAGGDDNGKDHLWRYYEPTTVSVNGCVAVGKPADRPVAKVGDIFSYKIKFYNAGNVDLTNVVVKDLLPSGVSFISAAPAQNAGPNPLLWNVGTVLRGQKFEATVTVKATGPGPQENVVTVDTNEFPDVTATEITSVGLIPILSQGKSVNPTTTAPGGSVQYTIRINNIGSGPSGSPLIIDEYLPAGFTYVSEDSVMLNGADVTASTGVNTTSPYSTNQPRFTVPGAVNAGQSLVLKFTAKAGDTLSPGSYCNYFSTAAGSSARQTAGFQACVTVGGGKIGDTIWRDWDGDGTQDAGEEGIAGITVKLYAADGVTLKATTTTDANGNYLFTGLTAGTYVVKVNDGSTPTGYTQTRDPDSTVDNMHTVTLITDQQYLTADFGYRPTGTATIGDKVFEDIGNDGYFDSGTDSGIPNVTVWLYEDTDGDGAITAGVDALVATAQSDASGNYLFSNLAGAPYDYIVKVDRTDADIQTYFNTKYGSGTPYQPSTAEFTASPNLSGSDLDNDFGFWRVLPGSIGDQVFVDADNNGQYDAGETVLSNVTVNLYRDTNGNGVLDADEPLLQTTSTDVNGQYTFGNLGPGDYIVDVDQGDPDLPGGLTATKDPIAATLTAGQNKTDVDFPFVSVLTKSVDKATANPGDTLTFTINPYYPGPQLLSSVVVQDTVPYGTAFLNAGQGGELSPYTPQPASAGEITTLTTGQGIYSIATNTPQYRTWDGTVFGAQTASAALGATPNILIGAASPTRNEKIVVDIIANNPEVQAMRWNGTAWAALPIPPATGTAGALANLASNMRTLWGGAVAYEQLSGDAMLVWNNTTVAGTNRLTWNVWNGTSWGTNTDITATGEPQQMRIAAKPNSDEMVLVTSNASAYDYVRVWNGSAWSAATALDTASGGSQTAIQVAYEQQSGDAMVVYGKASDVKLYYRIYSGGTWGTEQSLDPTALGVTTQPQWVSIAADPNDDDIVVGVVTSGGKTWLSVWDGSAWEDPASATDTSLISTALNVGVAFETMSGQLLAAYGVSGATTVAYRTWSPDAGWSDEMTGPDIVGSPNVIALSPSPNSDRMMLSTNDSNSDAQYTLWDGDAWGVPFAASANTGNTANQPVLFLWDRQQPPSSTVNLTASPTTVLNGGAITVQMTLRATKRVTGAAPGALTATNLTGNPATVACGSPTPASQTVPANVPTTFTWTCTASSAATAAEFSFAAGATGAYAGVPGGSYTFASAESNSVQLLALGDRGTVTWDLGANAPAVDGVGADPGAALCPVTVTLYPTADTYIDSGNATNWYGDATTVVTMPAKKYALFKFDVSSLAGKTIQSALFGADVTTISKNASNHYDQIYRVKTAWTEGASKTNGATWSDPNGTGTAGVWASKGGKFGTADYDGATLYAVVGPETQNFYQYGDVTALVKDWTRSVSPVANNGLALISTGTDGNDGKYAAREASGTTTDPTLQVTYLQSTAGGCGTNTTTLYAQGDTYIDEKNAAVNYGQLTTLLTQPMAANANKYALLWFDARQVPPGATITSAVLDLLVTTNRTNHVDEVHVLKTPWYEAAASWNDSDATGSGDWASAGIFGATDYNATSLGTITPSSKAHKTLDITSAVNDWVNNGVNNRGLALISTGADTGAAVYASRETALANRPKLTITWSLAGNPGPSTLVSFSAVPMLTTPGTIKVTMTASSTSAGTITAVTAPSPLGIAGENGASATCGSATLKSADATISSTSDPVIYEWTCTATAGDVPGSVTFSGKPTGTNGVFNTAKSNSVLITPPLTYQATVNSPAAADVARNTATIQAKEPDVQLTPDVCYAVADSIDNAASDNDILVTWDRSTGGFADVGTGTGTTHAEAAAWNLAQTVLYTTNRDATVAAGSDRFGTINATTGVYTAIGRLVSTANPLEGALGNFTVLDVDGMSFDPITGKLYAVHRREDATNGNTLLDVLFQINPATGFHVEDAYGPGVDYVVLRTDLLPTPLYDVDDIAFNPLTGELYAIANDSTTGVGDKDRLVKVNKATGALTDVGRITNASGGAGVDDMEGLSFLGDGTLYGVTGNTPGTPNDNSLWRIDTTTAVATKISAFPSHGDYEALACQDGEVEPGDTVIPPTSSNTTETALTASIGDYVWVDLDGDKVQDANEPPLAGVQVCATDGTTTLCDTTDGDGLYRIFGLTAGAWTVTVDLSTTPTGYQPTTPTSLSVTLAANEQYSDADFGLRPPGAASIGDTVCLDPLKNGCDAGDAGLPFITVKLYKDTDNNGSIDAGDVLFGTTTTDADGKYLFTGLYGGDYLVTVDPNSEVTSPYGGTTTLGAALDLVSGTDPHDVTLSDGQAYTTADFGYNWAGSIGDYVWWDNDTEGDQDEGIPVVGAFVMLYFDANNNGVIDQKNGDYQIAGMLTGADGKYLFDNLPPGNYLVDVYEDSLTTGGVRDVVPTTADVVAVPLAAGQDVDTADFGYYRGALVQGHVFWDEDRNGGLDPSEQDAPHLLENVTVDIRCAGADGIFGNGDDFTRSADTDAEGYFKFIVPSGQQCTLAYAQGDIPAAYGDETTPASYTFTAVGGEDWHPSFDFGVDNSGAVGDFVWDDLDGDGVQDAGEPGIAGVTVHLCTASPCSATNAIATMATGADGRYLFEGLPDGAYYVAVDSATLPNGFVETYDSNAPTNDNQSSVTVTGGDTFLDEDFGYRYPVSGQSTNYTIAGAIWNDANGDGVRDTGEAGIPGVRVILDCGAAGAYVLTTTGVATGPNWSLGNLPDGTTCTVTVDETTLPSLAYTQTGDPDVTSPPACAGAACDATTIATVSPDDLNNDFGYHQLFGSISGTVCAATDGNGLCEAGENGLPGATVTLIFAGPDGILGTGDDTTTTQTTAPDGSYSFTGLQPGLYQVAETNPFGYTSVADRDGGNPDNISIVLGLNQTITTRDFEDIRPAQVSGVVFEDLNLDGDRDPGEPPIAAVPVTLRNGAGVAITTVNTDALGYYEFTGLLPGSYRVTEANLATYTSTGDADGAANGIDRIDVTLAMGDNLTQRNFGDVRPGSIAGVVFVDANNNGVQDSGEGPLANVTVCASPDGGVTTYCDTTDATGAYMIPNLPPDDYVVTETDPAGYISTTPNTVPVTVGSNEAVTGVNYGDEPPVANTYSIAGTVCVNVNGDGICDANEAPLPGVTVKLYNGAGTVIATTTTDAAGDYLFVNVPNGAYKVVETDPLHYVSVNDADSGTDNTIAVTVAGANITGRDFIDAAQTGGLAGTVFEDLNRNGQYDAGEPGIPGVSVYLDTDNDGVKDAGEPETATDANGDYAFANLAPGPYTIRELDPAGYISTGDVDGPNDNKIVATVPPGVTVTDQDFGDVALGSISGVVWNDTNLNGIQDGGEAGIPNVLVCAVPAAGGAVICNTTDAAGAYTLPNLPPGAYTVVEADPNGYVSTTPNTVPETVASGEDITGLDFGDVPPNPALGSIRGTVCVNVDNDGVCDADEAPLAGVTVELWLVGGGSPLRTTTTDVNGDYLFPNLAAGTYRVEEVNPANYTSVNDADGSANGKDAILPISINGNAVTDRDFIDTPTLGSISGKVCNDLNRDGVCGAGEAGLPNVTVTLYNSAGVPTTVTTDGSGNYLFNNLPPGDYTVVEVDPASYGSTGDVYGANDNLIAATVPAGGSVTNRNFADGEEPGAITGVVYNDLNGDGNYDPGEPGIPNVQVCLAPAGGGAATCTTTNAGGQYAFTGLAPGDYTVTETDPSGYVSTGDVDGAGNGDNTITPITVAAGEVVVDRNFFDRYLEQAKLGVAKRAVGNPVYNGNGTFDVTYEILVQNIGNIDLSQLQVVDDLTLTFVSPATFAVASVSSADFAVNSTYDGIGGTGDTDLLAGTDTLLPLHEGRITLVVRVNPGGVSGPYYNNATGSGRSPGGTLFSDVSTDGDDPDTDTLGKTPADNLDASDDAVPTPVSFDLPASYTVAKTLVTTGDPRIGGQVVFSIHIENTGLRPITVLPLQDVYNKNYLIYGFGTLYSIPASDNNTDSGTIDWSDLTVSFGKDLGVGEGFEVIVVFTARADTTGLTPDGKTPNTATVHDAFAGAVPLGPLSSEARVKILQPTGVTLAGFTAATTAGGVQVRWQTASETGIIGYNLLRRRGEAAGYQAVNAEPIIAQYAGQDRGGAYAFQDNDLPAGAYTYRLEALRPDGSAETLGTIEVVIP